MDKIMEQLKEVSNQLDKQIKKASRESMLSDKAVYQFARMKIQEAITRLLEG